MKKFSYTGMTIRCLIVAMLALAVIPEAQAAAKGVEAQCNHVYLAIPHIGALPLKPLGKLLKWVPQIVKGGKRAGKVMKPIVDKPVKGGGFRVHIPPPAVNATLRAVKHYIDTDKKDNTSLYTTRAAAEQGDATAQYNLGVRYYKGEGVGKDRTEAVKWFRSAAEQGLAWAQYNLGVCYYNGDGVNRDCTAAMKWFRLAAARGDNDAKRNLQILENKAACP